MNNVLPTQAFAADLERLDREFPNDTVVVETGVRASFRSCGAAHEEAVSLVCLHGIGSGAASWVDVALLLAGRARLVAWSAPGYGDSTPLTAPTPVGADYAQRLLALLDALAIRRCVLVGHSLGAVVAAATLRQQDVRERFAALVLLSPAQGYGAPGRTADRERVRGQRLAALADLGIAGMAADRSARLVSEQAPASVRGWVQWNMAQLREQGYRQAVELLCGSDLLAALPPSVPVTVACGALDVVTPPARCAEVARRCGVELELIPAAGHACYVEQPAAVAHLLERALDAVRI